MATFTGTRIGEEITTSFVSPSVTALGGILPSLAIDIIRSKGGADLVEAGGRADLVVLGRGADVFVWNDGDGDDVVRGGRGIDTATFTSTAMIETMGLTRLGNHVAFTNTSGNVIADLDGIEQIVLTPLGERDDIELGKLAGTDVEEVAIDLAGVSGINAGDGFRDHIEAVAAKGAQTIGFASAGTSLKVKGLPYKLEIVNIDVGLDRLVVDAAGGDDRLDAAGMAPDFLGTLVLRGGKGEDVLLSGTGGDNLVGDDGRDVLRGRAGDDFLNGGAERDILKGGDGEDRFAFFDEFAVAGVDRIRDFEVGIDEIVLNAGVFNPGNEGGLGDGFFYVGPAAHDADDRIIYDPVKGLLLWDEDGIGGVAAIKFAKLDKGLAITEGDFDEALLVV